MYPIFNSISLHFNSISLHKKSSTLFFISFLLYSQFLVILYFFATSILNYFFTLSFYSTISLTELEMGTSEGRLTYTGHRRRSDEEHVRKYDLETDPTGRRGSKKKIVGISCSL